LLNYDIILAFSKNHLDDIDKTKHNYNQYNKKLNKKQLEYAHTKVK